MAKRKEKKYKFGTVKEYPLIMVTGGQKKSDRSMNRVFTALARYEKAQANLAAVIEKEFGPAYKAALKAGRKQASIKDPTDLRKVTIRHQDRIILGDQAFEAKTYIDEYIERHTKSKTTDPDARNILTILKSVFTGRKQLLWNAAVQAFLDLTLSDQGLRTAQKLLRNAKKIEKTRIFTSVDDRQDREDDWNERARY